MKKNHHHLSFFIILFISLILGLGIYAGFSMKKPAKPPSFTKENQVDDEKELKRLGASVADSWKIHDLQYEVTIPNRVGDYARVIVNPTNQTLDPLQIIFKKTNGKWTYLNMGSSFPDLEQQMPDLFRD